MIPYSSLVCLQRNEQFYDFSSGRRTGESVCLPLEFGESPPSGIAAVFYSFVLNGVQYQGQLDTLALTPG